MEGIAMHAASDSRFIKGSSRMPNTAPVIDLTATEKALEAHRRLCQHYGCPLRYFHTIDPMSELVSSLLSHRTLNRD